MSQTIYKAFYDTNNQLHYIKAIATDKRLVGPKGSTGSLEYKHKVTCQKCGTVHWKDDSCNFCYYYEVTEISVDEINRLVDEKKEQIEREKKLDKINKELSILNQ